MSTLRFIEFKNEDPFFVSMRANGRLEVWLNETNNDLIGIDVGNGETHVGMDRCKIAIRTYGTKHDSK